MRQFGWHYQTELVATYERVTLAQAWDLPTVQYLNALAYLKAKREHEEQQMKRLQHGAIHR